MSSFIQRHSKQIAGIIGCFDRIVIMGSLPMISHADGMSLYMHSQNIRIFDYARSFAEPLRDEIRTNAERVAQENGIQIEYIRSSKSFRKETRIQGIIKERGGHPGLVHIFSAVEPCACFEPWHDKPTHKTRLRYKDSKCVHYYFYFIDSVFGLCYLRVPTWAPFRLQFYCNGHNWLASRLAQHNVDFTQYDNTFVKIADFDKAQLLADQFPVEALHQLMDQSAALYCPVASRLSMDFYWSIMQIEYSTDIVFHRQSELALIYDTLVRTAIHTVKPDNVATFLGRKLTGNYQDELGNDFHTRLEGTRIKHHMGPASIKMYDKQKMVLRIETTTNDVSFFKHYRTVEHKDGTSETKFAPVKKTAHSLGALRELMSASNHRYLEFISALDDPSSGYPKVEKLSKSVRRDDRTYRGFNVFDPGDLALFRVLVRGEFNINGMKNRTLRRFLPGKTGPQVSRILKRLHLHGLIRKVGRTYKYYLTAFGREVIISVLKLRELTVIPSLAQAHA